MYGGRKKRHLAVSLGLLGFLTAKAIIASAQSMPEARGLITESIDENRRITLTSATHPLMNLARDRGSVADNVTLQHMYLQLNRAPEVQQAVDDLVRQLHDPTSDQYHHWLHADEVAERFPLSFQDVHKVRIWLQRHGLTINFVHPASGIIDFSGTAAAVRDAFHTEMHYFWMNRKAYIANISDPHIPAALAPAIRSVVTWSGFRPRRVFRTPPRPHYIFTNRRETFQFPEPGTPSFKG